MFLDIFNKWFSLTVHFVKFTEKNRDAIEILYTFKKNSFKAIQS